MLSARIELPPCSVSSYVSSLKLISLTFDWFWLKLLFNGNDKLDSIIGWFASLAIMELLRELNFLTLKFILKRYMMLIDRNGSRFLKINKYLMFKRFGQLIFYTQFYLWRICFNIKKSCLIRLIFEYNVFNFIVKHTKTWLKF